MSINNDRTKQEAHLDNHTQARYEALGFFEKEEITRWLKLNLKKLPLLSQKKQAGLESLLAGNHESHLALLLIRHAMKALEL